MKKIASFFTGAGGLDLGLEGNFSYLGATHAANPFETVFACDIRPDAKTAYDAFWATRSNTKLTVESIVDWVAHKTPIDVDIVTGGFPCQDFSLAGNRKGFSSVKGHSKDVVGTPVLNRGLLYLSMCDAIKLLKPKIFIAENVKGLVLMPHAYSQIKSDFTALGYTLQAKVLKAMEFGVPQSRERVIFIGVRNNAISDTIKQAIETNVIQLHPASPKSSVTTTQAFAGLLEPQFSLDLDQQHYSKAKRLKAQQQGQIEVDPNGVGPTIRSEHHGNIEFRRHSNGQWTTEIANGCIERRLTVRECARLQSFPDNYKFIQLGISGSKAYELIGNAVPPVLAWHLGQHLSKIWPTIFNEPST